MEKVESKRQVSQVTQGKSTKQFYDLVFEQILNFTAKKLKTSEVL